MTKIYTNFLKSLFIVLLGSMAFTTTAQTTLVKGDLAFTGFIGNGTVAGTDEFSFVLLRAITANTVIKFTENGWLRTSSTTGSFRTGEGTLQYTSVALPAGAEVRIVCSATPTATYAGMGGSAGTVSILAATEGNGTAPSFSANGDQIIAYQGTSASPTFVSAIHMNVYSIPLNPAPGVPGGDAVTTTTADWDGSFSNAVASGLPSGAGVNFLTNGVDAIWIPGAIAAEVDNARFNCAGPLTTVAQIRAAVYNVANWTTSNDAPGFTLPTSCNYLGILLPVRLISFQAQNNITDVATKWEVTNEVDLNNYQVERSFDNKNFDKIATITANNNSGNGISTYTYKDYSLFNNDAPVIYYRLKINDRDGKFYYSQIVSIRNKKGASLVVDNLTNPVKNNLSFTLASKNAGTVQIQLVDINGKVYATRSVQVTAGSNTTINMPEAVALAQGIYLLKISNAGETTVTKFIK
jgi:Secretion system C-terminal sorting domain